MSIVQTHSIILTGGDKRWRIVLRPLCDVHLPYLYKWYADPDVTYFSEDAVGICDDEADVQDIYSAVSQDARCFPVEANGVPVGDCWLQRMNLSAQPLPGGYRCTSY